MTSNVDEVLAETFRRESVETSFALLGDANIDSTRTMSGLGTRMILKRDEHCAVSAAMSYTRSAENVSVAAVTCGSGVTQTLTALPAAVRVPLPLIMFAVETPLGAQGCNQAKDQTPLVAATGAANHALHHVVSIPRQIRAAGQGRLRPSRHRHGRNGRSPCRRSLGLCSFGREAGCLTGNDPSRQWRVSRPPVYLRAPGRVSSAIARTCRAESDLMIAVGARLARHNTDKDSLFAKADFLLIDVAPRAPLGEPKTVGWRRDVLARAISQTPGDMASIS